MTNPYRNLPPHCFWSKSMTDRAPWQIDPVTSSQIIRPGEKVSTMGSCFAQHLARHIAASGLDYFVPEQAEPGMSEAEAKRKNYGVFSARYGNVYTVRQALQLFGRAFGSFKPKERFWKRGERFVDAFRPQIDPDCFGSADEVEAEAEKHLGFVRRIFMESSWFVFTLGLTEGWESKADGAIFPTAPGVAGGAFDPSAHQFVNFTADEVRNDLFKLITAVTEINPQVRFLLTVSPVPLIATYEKRDVWVSTTYSKAALRVAADAAERSFENVIYFPSYEIITSPAAGNSYFEDDLRGIKDIGVQHVMRTFSAHFLAHGRQGTAGTELEQTPVRTIKLKEGVICDEEILAQKS